MDKVVTNRKSFLATIAGLALVGTSVRGKTQQTEASRSDGPVAKALPLKVSKAPRSVAREGRDI